MNKYLIWVLTVLCALAIMAIVFLANQSFGPELFAFVYEVPGGDKTGHAVLMGTLSLLVNLSWKDRRWQVGRFSLQVGSVLVFLVVAAEECSQLLIQHRTFDLLDLLSDIVGITMGGLLASWILRKFGTKSATHKQM